MPPGEQQPQGEADDDDDNEDVDEDEAQAEAEIAALQVRAALSGLGVFSPCILELNIYYIRRPPRRE